MQLWFTACTIIFILINIDKLKFIDKNLTHKILIQQVICIDGKASSDIKSIDISSLFGFFIPPPPPPPFSSSLHFEWHLRALCLGNISYQKRKVQ